VKTEKCPRSATQIRCIWHYNHIYGLIGAMATTIRASEPDDLLPLVSTPLSGRNRYRGDADTETHAVVVCKLWCGFCTVSNESRFFAHEVCTVVAYLSATNW